MQTYLEDAPFLGPLVFVGGGEWRKGCDFDADLITRFKLNSKNASSPGSDDPPQRIKIPRPLLKMLRYGLTNWVLKQRNA